MKSNIMGKVVITVRSEINLTIPEVWNLWTTPEDIVKWNYASEDWHTPKAFNELSEGGSFNFRMEARDGSFGFDFYGVYDSIIPNKKICYTLGDGRKVEISFEGKNNKVEIVESFEAESTNPVEMQKSGWQSILNNFKKYAESRY
jgi:uncharacterized protein YndB with AHSA1/START domain